MEEIKLIQDSTKFGKDWVVAELKDLVKGLKHIIVRVDVLTPTEIRATDFTIYDLRGQYIKGNGKIEPLHEYTAYKDYIKRWVLEGVVFIYKPKSKTKVVEVEKQETTLFG